MLEKNTNIPTGLAGKKNLIFSNIAHIYQVHKNFFYPELNQCDDVKSIAVCFAKHVSFYFVIQNML